MRIAVVHSFYRSDVPSGENTAVLMQADILRRAGHEVRVFGVGTDRQRKLAGYPLRAAWRVATGFGPDPTQALHRWRPDVVVVHNLFPNIGTRWPASWPGRLVVVLHNFRPLCANGLLLREGRMCTRCPDDGSHNAVRFGCYHDSRAASLPLALATRGSVAGNPLLRRADAVVLVSAAAAALYQRYGLPTAKTVVIANPMTPAPEARRPRRGWVAVSRLDAGKGIDDLVAAWPQDEPLDVIGSGPQLPSLRAVAPAGIRFLGAMPNAAVRRDLGSYEGLVFPGVAVEGGHPLTLLEALAAGTPLVTRAGSAGQRLVEEHGVGVTTGADLSDLAVALQRVRDRPELSPRARQVWQDHYGAEAWLRAMVPVLSGDSP